MGHGSNLLGHGHKRVVAALQEQARRAVHLGGMHDDILRWAQLVTTLVPSIDQVRFTSSGNEATYLACRIASAYTKRPLVLKLDGHFHGWHDIALAHHVDPRLEGIRASKVRDVVMVSPLGSPRVVERILKKRNVAALILEPGGGSNGALPVVPEYLQELRSLTRRYGTLLIFDEVVSGFRYALGGAQALSSVLPDLTVMAKIAAGGLPGGIVGGRRKVMNVFSSRKTTHGGHVTHAGTFNANPLTAAAAIATLTEIRNGAHIQQAADAAAYIADRVNVAAADAEVDVRLFATSSILHMIVGTVRAGVPACPSVQAVTLPLQHRKQHELLRRALLLSGLDMHACRGWVSSAHKKPSILRSVVLSFRKAFELLKAERAFRSAA